MRIAFKKRSIGEIEFGVIYGSMALLLLGSARVLPVLSLTPSCVFKGLTGIPCPTCGTTRSVVYLSQGDAANALVMNPLATLGLMAAVAYFFYSVITLLFNLPKLSFLLTNREKTAIRSGVIMLFLAQWAYLIMSK